MSDTVISAVVLGADGLPDGHEGVENVIGRLDRLIWIRGQFGFAGGVESAKLVSDSTLGAGTECIALAQCPESAVDGGGGRAASTGSELLEGCREGGGARYESGVGIEGREKAGAGGADRVRWNERIGLEDDSE